ncbi:hypothetical protein GCM10022419_067290 [Nonomuraea rosea]|uniref:Uncharacterized protein n=1 Tax=Nonomuraea rosea TaxID=638574 RepID=A0ABP6Y395_9ACTN
MKVPFGALPASNVPEIDWFAPPPATFWLGVDGPSTYRPMLSCMTPVRAEIVTEEPEITWPSEGEVICPAEPACRTTTAACANPLPSAMDPATIIPAANTLPTTVTTLPSVESLAPPDRRGRSRDDRKCSPARPIRSPTVPEPAP